jgi:predicted nucleic acid-binding protein
MPEAEAVLDASPLILLSRSSHLDLLLSLQRPLVVPFPVFEEIRAKGSADSAVLSVERAAFLRIVPTPPIPDAIERWDLGRGESSVLALAKEHPGALALLDDREARRCAESLDIPLLGTAGLVLLAKRRGVVALAAPLLRELIAVGMYLSERTLAELLRRAGE